MTPSLTRRGLLTGGTATLGTWLLDPAAATSAPLAPEEDGPSSPLHEDYPAQEPGAVRSVVAAAHGNFERVRELVDARPELAKASWDWGFGDWESALGAASHTGNCDIALYLIDQGARPNLFTAAMLGQLALVRAFVEARSGIQSQPGPHGIPLLVHARLGGEPAAAVVAYLEALGGADTVAADLPLDLPRETFLGNYRFANGPQGAFEVSLDQRGNLMIRRGAEGVPRGLSHRGEGEFAPAGAPSARIRFLGDGTRITALEIRNPELVVTALRREGP